MPKVPLIIMPLARYVDFQGRSRRAEYWLWVLLQIIVFWGLEGVMFGTVPWASLKGHPELMMNHMMGFMPWLNILQLAIFIPNLAVGVRRLHDTNRTGWWLVLPVVAAILGLLLWLVINAGNFAHFDRLTNAKDSGAMLGFIGSLFLCVYLPIIIACLVLFVFNVLDGTPGNNRFGPDPKGRGNIEVFN